MTTLREGYTVAPQGTPARLTGAIPTPRHRLARALPYSPIGVAPSKWWWIPGKLSYWLNNQYGICVTAEEAFAKACSGVFISDAEAKRWASSHNVLNGAMLDEVLDWMASKGFNQDNNSYNDGGKAAVDYTDAPTLCNAIAQGPVKIGIASGQLGGVVGQHNGWFATGFRHDTSEDHCVSLCGYGTTAELAAALGVTVPSGVDGTKPAYMLFTWDTIGVIDIPSMLAITGEAWLRVPTNVTVGTGTPTPDPVVTPTPDPGPGPGPGPQPPIPPVGNVTAMLLADPMKLPKEGGKTVISWMTKNADVSVTLDGEKVAAVGSREELLTDSHDFKLEAKGTGGQATDAVHVQVGEPPPPPPPPPPPEKFDVTLTGSFPYWSGMSSGVQHETVTLKGTAVEVQK